MRTFFFTLGLFAVLQGTVCLGVETLTLNDFAAEQIETAPADRTVRVPIWIGTTLAATGLVTLMYAIALPRKLKAE